jgi:hypothetical protein
VCPFGPPRITEVWQHQRSRSGSNGQPPESSHLVAASSTLQTLTGRCRAPWRWPLAQTFRTNCGDEAWLLCGAVGKPTDNNVGVYRHHGLTRGRGDQHEIDVPMSTMPSHTQPEFSAPSFLVKPPVEAFSIPPTELKSDRPHDGRRSFRKRTSLAFAYYMMVFSVGVAATLAWQIYGDAARRLIATATSTSDQQQLNAISLDLDAVRRSIDGLAIGIGTSIASSIATSQEQTTRSIDRLTASLEQMTHEIAKLQAVEQYVLHKSSEPPPHPAPAPTPVPRPSQAPPVLSPARNP